MSRDMMFQIAYLLILAILVAIFAVGYAWLMRIFRRRRAPQSATLAQRWLAAFVPVVPLCIFGAYVLFRTRPAAALDSLAFGALGALVAATSCVSISLATRGAPNMDADLNAAAEVRADAQVEAVAAQRFAATREWPGR
ncbi:MAG TPA: hypothetical protein VE338_21770 [Ktedonobacterales bacterium]|nr:hypothetical protein [Ktedonobacterales bacterium]